MSDPWLTAAYEVDGWRCPACTFSQPQPGLTSRHGVWEVACGEFMWCPGGGQQSTRITASGTQRS